jgi:hypothetical protein
LTPIPDWVKGQLDEWLEAAGIARGRIFRRVTRMGQTWGDCMTEKVDLAHREGLREQDRYAKTGAA